MCIFWKVPRIFGRYQKHILSDNRHKRYWYELHHRKDVHITDGLMSSPETYVLFELDISRGLYDDFWLEN